MDVRRWLINLLRAAHLVGVTGVGAGLLAEWPPAQWQPYAALLFASGAAILLLDWRANPRYLLQVNGLAVLAKLTFLAWLILQPERSLWLFWAILVFSALIAHAPGKLRHFEAWPRR